VMISKLVVDHPLFIRRRELLRDPAERDLFGEETILAAAFKECAEVVAPGDGERIELGNQRDAFPRLDRPLFIEYAPFSPPDDEEGREHLGNQLSMAGEIGEAISDMVVGTAVLIRDELMRLCYLGPFRETPSRNHTPPRYPDPARWATGLAAWERLYASPSSVQEVNKWLSGPDSLQIGYQLRLKELKEIPLSSPLMVLLQSERAFDDLEDIRRMISDYPTRSTLCLVEENTDIEVFPHDVGIGVSQLIPVVALALDKDAKIAAIEQPELHVHPAVQVRLGDLFIDQSARDQSRTFILETHSEHLMLRLLRRIRETSENDLPAGHPGLTPDKVAVIYVEEGEPRQANSQTPEDLNPLLLTPLRIDPTGEFSDRWPHGFFEERGEELFGQ
jgi:hypothetical protein